MAVRDERNSAQVIREEASKLFFERGYEATTLRQVAEAAGLKVGSLYNHISSKEELLQQVMGGILDDLMVTVSQVVEDVEDADPIGRLQAALSANITFHAERAEQVFIGNTELRSLPADVRAKVVAKRAEFESFLESLVEEAGRSGEAQVVDSKIHVYSFVAQATHVASWYRPGGRLSLGDIVRIYTRLALRELKVPDADERTSGAGVG